MPDTWRACLQGQGEIDLRQTRILSDHFYMWSTASTLSKLTGFFASKALRGRIDELAAKDFPPVFCDPRFKGKVYRLVDMVIDTPSLLKNLSDPMEGRLFKVNWRQAKFFRETARDREQVCLDYGDGQIIRAQQFICAAGKGNQQLMDAVGADWPPMQLRPLQQVMVKHPHTQARLYAHCMGMETTPRLTISTHTCDDGSCCWYLGGQLSEQGVKQTAEQLMLTARNELQALFPWLEWHDARFATYPVERAEPRQKNMLRPDQAFFDLARVGKTELVNFSVAWPTKLTLSPDLGRAALDFFRDRKIIPGQFADDPRRLPLSVPKIADSPWDVCTWQSITI
jgi:hypothetical protein